MSFNIWTPADDERLIAMRAAGTTYLEISTCLGRTLDAAKRRFRLLSLKAEKRLEGHTPAVKPYHHVFQIEERVVVPDHVLQERDRRLAMQPRSLTALLMGDPL